MALLAERGVFVEACPGSNVITGAVTELAAHPLREFLSAGIPCNLNTDDRALFGTDLASEYRRAATCFALTEQEQAAMQQAALDAAFTDDVTIDLEGNEV